MLFIGKAEYNLMIFLDSAKEGSGALNPRGIRGKAEVGGLGTNPVGGMGNKVPQKLTFFGLKVRFYAKYVNNVIF